MRPDAIGWIATAVFSTSYFFRRPSLLCRIQAGAACLWIVYGCIMGAWPVVIANVIVATTATFTSFRERQRADVPAM